MRKTLTALIAAASLSAAALACPTPEPVLETHVEPRDRDERIEWRARIGIEAAHAYIFDHCVPVEGLEEAFASYGEPYGLSAREVAESVLWGVYHHRDTLVPSTAPTVHAYLEEQLETHGERILESVNILFGEGPYAGTMRWYIYGPMKNQLSVDSVERLRSRIGAGLSLARRFTDLAGMYEELQHAWAR